MGLRQRKWARKTKLRLRTALGNRCVICHSQSNLEFDCVLPLGDNHGKKEYSWRMSIYNRQHRDGNLQLLCDFCHNLKSIGDNNLLREYKRLTKKNNPF